MQKFKVIFNNDQSQYQQSEKIVSRVNTIVEQIMHLAGSNNITTYKLLPVSCFHNRQFLHVK